LFGNLSERLSDTFKNLRGKGKLSAADIDGTLRDIRRALLEADVALEVVKDFTGKVRERALGDEVSKALNPAQQVVQIVNDELKAILGGEARKLSFAKNPPTVIMLAGLQGSGKTTLAGKLAKWLKEQNHTPILVAADLQRPNAVTQLQVLGEKVGVPVFAPEPGNGVGNPVKVSKDAIAFAKKSQFSVVIVDTAGRLGVDEEMMTQARDIRNAVDPDEVLFVVDSMLGQDAVNVAKAFHDGVGVSGIVLTKLDGDSRGGAALSVATITGAPILFSSTGEGLDAFEPFYPDRMASRILDMGDILTLIEQAQKTFDEDESKKLAEKMANNEFTLQDFLEQMQQLKKMGSMKGLLGMLPGVGQMKKQLEDFDESEITRTEAIIYSMTPLERTNPKVLNGSRRMRIARGSGTTVTDVNQLIQKFEQAAKMMKTMARGGMPNIPGTNPALTKATMGAGLSGGGKKNDKKKKGSKSGNPAKRAAENAGQSFGGSENSGPGSAFGLKS
jgi:signal recognition particle subunit SRP54